MFPFISFASDDQRKQVDRKFLQPLYYSPIKTTIAGKKPWQINRQASHLTTSMNHSMIWRHLHGTRSCQWHLRTWTDTGVCFSDWTFSHHYQGSIEFNTNCRNIPSIGRIDAGHHLPKLTSYSLLQMRYHNENDITLRGLAKSTFAYHIRSQLVDPKYIILLFQSWPHNVGPHAKLTTLNNHICTIVSNVSPGKERAYANL